MAFVRFVVFVAPLLQGAISQQFQWECSPLNTDDNRFFLPDLEEMDDKKAARIAYWLIMSAPATYIYPINGSQLNCSGIVTDVEYCYNCLTNNLNIETTVFTLFTFEQDDTTFTVTDTIDIRTTPTSDNCTGQYSMMCCDVTALSVEEQFEISPENFAYGVTVPPRSVNLLGWGNTYPQYYVGQYKISDDPILGSNYSFGNATNASHRILKFHISPTKSSSTPAPSATSVMNPVSTVALPTPSGTMVTTGAVTGAQLSRIRAGLIGGVVGGVIALLLVVLVVIFVAPIILKRLRRKFWSPRGRGYSGLVTTNAIYSEDHSPVINDENSTEKSQLCKL